MTFILVSQYGSLNCSSRIYTGDPVAVFWVSAFWLPQPLCRQRSRLTLLVVRCLAGQQLFPRPRQCSASSIHCPIGLGCMPSCVAQACPWRCSGKSTAEQLAAGLSVKLVLRALPGQARASWMRLCVRNIAPARTVRRLRRPDGDRDRPPKR